MRVGAPRGLFLVVVLTLGGLAVVGFELGDLLTPFERENCRIADVGCSSSDQLADLGGKLGGKLDGILSTVGVLAMIAACFFLAAAMEKVPGWERWVGLGGLFERLLALAGAVAIGALAWRLFLDASPLKGLINDSVNDE